MADNLTIIAVWTVPFRRGYCDHHPLRGRPGLLRLAEEADELLQRCIHGIEVLDDLGMLLHPLRLLGWFDDAGHLTI